MHPRKVKQMFHFPCASRGWGHLVMHGLASTIIKALSARGSLHPAAPHVQQALHVCVPNLCTYGCTHTHTCTDECTHRHTRKYTETDPHTHLLPPVSCLSVPSAQTSGGLHSFVLLLFLFHGYAFNQKLSPSVSPTPASAPLLQFRP